MLMSESLVTVSMVGSLGRDLSFVIGLHCSVKKLLNRFAFTKNQLQIRDLLEGGGINEIFESLTDT